MRNTRFYNEQLEARRKQHWLERISKRGALNVAWQPILDAQNPAHIFAHEALLRAWDGDSLIYPNALFNAAGTNKDSINALDLKAREVGLESAQLQVPAGKIFLNFSPCFPNFQNAKRALRRTIRQTEKLGLPRERIVFEITETHCLSSHFNGLRVLELYREAGFSLALDDFGAGYSSLSLLHLLHPDYVKLDQSLMRDVHLNARKALIARRAVELAHELGTPVIAEGIECEGEYSWARDLGAAWVQGFLFAVPAFTPIWNYANLNTLSSACPVPALPGH